MDEREKNIQLGGISMLIAEFYSISAQLTQLQLKLGEKILAYEKMYKDISKLKEKQ